MSSNTICYLSMRHRHGLVEMIIVKVVRLLISIFTTSITTVLISIRDIVERVSQRRVTPHEILQKNKKSAEDIRTKLQS